MVGRHLLLALLLSVPLSLSAQSSNHPLYEVAAGYTRLSNSLNGVPGSQNPLNGVDVSLSTGAWHNIRFKLDGSGYAGTNLGAAQHPYFIMGGAQYDRPIGRETLFGEVLVGEAGVSDRFWGAKGAPGMSASIATFVGGGLDTPIDRHFRIRLEGGYQYSYFSLVQSVAYPSPYRIPGLPTNFARIGAGIVWVPRFSNASFMAPAAPPEKVESEVILEDMNSFGHFHLFANSWWSYLHTAGVEYDRHSWGRLIGARFDYVAEVLPFVVLKQPAQTNVFGGPDGPTLTFKDNAGLGFSPIGFRLLWRNGKGWMPYYSVKGGLIAFSQKSISEHASYENFSLEQSGGLQFRLTDQWDFRAAYTFFHFSDGFVVPSNPGADMMMYNAAFSYHLRPRQPR
jgi:hypothetical protein